MSAWKLLPSVLLCLALAWPVSAWVVTAWADSPLDRQGPFWALAGSLVYAMAWLDRRTPEMEMRWLVALWLVMVGVLAAMFGMVGDINFIHAAGIVCMVAGLALAIGLPVRGIVVGSVLWLLALPFSAFLFGKAAHAIAGLGFEAGVVLKWVLAAALLLMTQSRWAPASWALLFALPLAWFALWLLPGGSAPPLAPWLGAGAWASLLVASVALLYLVFIGRFEWRRIAS
ncbi:MAG: hypothetical protein ACPGUC_02520 [Gammaproteobacteria bacterium]